MKKLNTSKIFFIILGLVMLTLSLSDLIKNVSLLNKCDTKVEATIVDIRWTYHDTDGGEIYTPYIDYEFENNRINNKLDTVTSNHSYKVNDKLEIYINKNNPVEFIVKDKVIKQIIKLSIVVIISLAIMIIPFINYKKKVK